MRENNTSGHTKQCSTGMVGGNKKHKKQLSNHSRVEKTRKNGKQVSGTNVCFQEPSDQTS